jgi:hypothetical protein
MIVSDSVVGFNLVNNTLDGYTNFASKFGTKKTCYRQCLIIVHVLCFLDVYVI